MTDMLAAALILARRGWRPIPLDHPSLRYCTGPLTDDHDPKTCNKRGKHPAGKWGTIAAHDPSEKWLASTAMFGGAARNVGVAVKLSGLIVLDEDKLDALSKMAAHLGEELPTTYRVRTAQGWHWYFLAPDGVEIGNRTKGTPLADFNIDVRGGKGDGGYVVAAGSLHMTGHVYTAEDVDAPVAPLPTWLVTMLSTEPEPDAPERERIDPDEIRYDTAERFLAQYARRVAEICHQGGAWREELFTAATDGWRLVELGLLDRDQLETDLNARCHAVWGADLDKRDERIWTVEARQRAMRSPWELDNTGGEKIPKDGPRERTEADADTDLFTDLGPFLDGDLEPEPTEYGIRRDDGMPLLYPGLTHMAVGETEAGKSWLALACVAAELVAGRRVLYVHWEEGDPRGTMRRLRQMGVARHLLASGAFRFVSPERPLNLRRVAKLAEHGAHLAVSDGVNAAMSLHGLNPNDAGEYGGWDALLARPLAATGSAVLSLDHVVKNRDAAQVGYAGGTVMKLNLVSGASFLLENVEPIRPGARGQTSVYVAKDRPGALRAVAAHKSGRRALFGTFWLDSTSALVVATLTKPGVEHVEDDGSSTTLDARALKVLSAVERLMAEKTREMPPTIREVQQAKPGVATKDVAAILDRLVGHGVLDRETGEGSAKYRPTRRAETVVLRPEGGADVSDSRP